MPSQGSYFLKRSKILADKQSSNILSETENQTNNLSETSETEKTIEYQKVTLVDGEEISKSEYKDVIVSKENIISKSGQITKVPKICKANEGVPAFLKVSQKCVLKSTSKMELNHENISKKNSKKHNSNMENTQIHQVQEKIKKTTNQSVETVPEIKRSHVKRVYKSTNPFQCTRCEYSTYLGPNFKRHMQIRHAENNETNIPQNHLKSITNQIHSEISPELICEFGETNSQTESSDKHLNDVIEIEKDGNIEVPEVRYLCPKCDQKLNGTNIKIVKNHFMHQHAKWTKEYILECNSNFICKICEFAFSNPNESAIFQHFFNHHFQPIQEKIVQKTKAVKFKVACDKCGKIHYSINGLAAHFKLVHRENINYECTTCIKSFTSPRDLECHVKEIHIR